MTHILKYSVFILLVSFLTLVPERTEAKGLHRQKREWIVRPRQLRENHDYTGLASIARIRSDKENYTKITYSLSGPGVDQPPRGVFGVDRNTGFVKIYSVLDREEIEYYHLIGSAMYADGSLAEKNIDLNITVLDENDCFPVIKVNQVGSVDESSAPGTLVMKVIGTDGDKPDTLFSQLHYTIVDQSPPGMFYIDSKTGEVRVQRSDLDRETHDTYKLTIRATDLNGQVGGNSGGGDIQVKITDINDNIPVLEKESYEGSVKENTINTEVMRIKALDMDMIHTDNWLAQYEIVSGNEAGYFTITTDSKTNEGIIMINKALDYEEMKVVNLDIAVANKAAYNFGSQSMTGAATSKSYPIKINVLNVKEGPRFQPAVKVVTISEEHSSTTLNQVITNYAAIDSDTLKTATNVRYAKLRDQDNWLRIDEKTADIRLNKMPDRESTFLVNGTYYAEIICIDNEDSTKTATGTIAIQVEDFNDHCPKLTTTTQTMCLEDNFLFVTAKDEDEFPNSAPFNFEVVSGSSQGKWHVEDVNETTVILRDDSNLWPGQYKVKVIVTDQQGKACDDDQVIDVTVCTCEEDAKMCTRREAKTVEFGAPGILLLLLGLLLLLLVPLLLLFCLCGGAAALGDFKPIPFDTKQQLISYHTEGQGEDKEVPLLNVPVEVDGGAVGVKDVNTYGSKFGGGLGGAAGGAVGGGAAFGGGLHTSTLFNENMHMYNQYGHTGGRMGMDYLGAGTMTGNEHRYNAGAFDGMALSEAFLGEYYATKYNQAAQQSQQKDSLQIYDYEGQESLAGSVGCCSLLENDDDLSFLNDLGPKFKTLAEVCQGSSLTKSVETGVSIAPPRPVSPIRPPTHTHVHTHTETFRDRDRVNTSNVASGSSTFVQEELFTERAQSSVAVPKVHVRDKVVIPNQTVLIQQPTMYYAATPMYVVDPKPQVMLVAGAPQQAVGQVAQVGLTQGVVQVGGLQAAQGMVQVGGLQGSQGVVLVDRKVGAGGVTGQVVQGLPQGTISRSRQVLLVENGSSGGEQVAQGFVQTGHVSTESGLEVRGQGLQVNTQSFSHGSGGSAGSNEDFALTATPKLQGSQRVVVQHKKVSVTEKNVETSSRA